jgi:hypothetical protein
LTRARQDIPGRHSCLPACRHTPVSARPPEALSFEMAMLSPLPTGFHVITAEFAEICEISKVVPRVVHAGRTFRWIT